MRQESFKMERPGLVKPGDKIQITEYQSYMNYSYIIEPAVAMSGCYPNSQRIKADVQTQNVGRILPRFTGLQGGKGTA